MRFPFIAIVTTVLLITASAPAFSATAWVTEKLKITLRSGESTRHKILRELFAGTELEVISTNPDTGFTKVKTPQGFEGYVMSRFVTETAPAIAQLDTLKTQLKQLEGKGNNGQLVALQKTVEELNQEVLRLTAQNNELQGELTNVNAVSGDALKLSDQHLDVLERNKMLENELSVAKAENQRLSSNDKREGFYNGIGAIILGIFIALVVPRFGRNKGNTEWS